ncbi:MAG TPA: thioredoxin domain-containing protein [Streptosporangiaceae bacterium]|nr:thioredoxin domain-containing protein [Streptosporangiaceae bacterium]
MTDPTRPPRIPTNATPEGDGVLVGDGPVRIDAFIDFLCPYCRQFELSADETLAELASSGQASIAYHPMNFLDAASTTNYSTRAAAASGCASDAGRFTEYAHTLYVHQPPEGGAGLTDTELADLGRMVGLDAPAFTTCMTESPYLEWPSYVTARALALGVEATPTVLVAGAPVRPEPRAVVAAVSLAAAH